MIRSFRNRPILFIFIIIAAVGALFYFKSSPKNKSTDKEQTRMGTVKKQDLIQRVTISGEVIPNRQTIILPPYKGYIKKIYVKIGDWVKEGDPIVSIVQSLQDNEEVFPLRTPFGGMVVSIQNSEGEFVKENTDPKDFIVKIVDMHKMFVRAKVPEIELVKVKLGQQAVIKVTPIMNRTYKGVVKELFLSPREKERWSDSTEVIFPVKIEFIEKDEALKPGMSAIIDIIANRKEGALTLAHEFILKKDNKYSVTLKNGEKRDITIGLQNEEFTEILSGIKEGDEIKQVDFLSLAEENSKK